MGILHLVRRTTRALALSRDALVVAIAAFGAANLLAGAVGGADRNDIWLRGAGAPHLLLDAAIVALALGVIGWRSPGRLRSALARGAALVLSLLCLLDAVVVGALVFEGRLASGSVLSLSLVLAALLACYGLRPHVPVADSPRPLGRHLLGIAGTAGAAALLVLLHLLTFGSSDYRRPADVAVVFGAAVRPDGTPSGALRDRTHTACRLYHAGHVSTLLLSGGRNPAVPVSEAACMAKLARAAGVPAEALILDETGLTSAASLATVARLAEDRSWARVLLVSHDYHLARIHLLSRDLGVSAFTVPALETGPWPTKPLHVFREVAAWTWHFLRSATGAS